MQPLAEALAGAIRDRGGEIRLRAPVTDIEQHGDEVRVEDLRARRAIVALPPPLAASIRFQPALSAMRQGLLASTPMGAVIKRIAVYQRARWRSRGWSGSSISDEGPVHATFDASPQSVHRCRDRRAHRPER